jgi:pyruvate/2-oxoglutarate dehydrogenase complex dihydrolipoamide acyltransferase (E2) component
MTTRILIPRVGMGTTEGTVAKWLKAEGDPVNAGEVIVEIEMAKAVQEVAAPVSGVLSRILLGEGETAEVATAIALIEEPPR